MYWLKLVKLYSLVTIIFFFTLAAHPASATTYYVADPKGADGIAGTPDDVDSSDGNPGTSEQPWATMERGMSNWGGTPPVVDNGDMVYLRDGNYGEVEMTNTVSRSSWDDAVTYKAEPGQDSVVFNHLLLRGFCNRYEIYEGLTIYRDNTPAPTEFDQTVLIKDGGYIKFIDMTIRGNGTMDAGTDGIDMDSGWTKYGVEILSSNPEAYTLKYVEFDGCTFKNSYFGIYTRDGSIREDLIITDNKAHELGSSFVTLHLTPYTGQALLSGNDIGHQAEFGIPPNNAHGSGIQLWHGNTIMRGNKIRGYGRTTGMRCGGYGVTEVSDLTIENNLMYDTVNNVRNGIWLNQLNENIIIRNNTILGRWKSSSGNRDRYRDILIINAFGAARDPSTWEIYNNIFVGNVVIELTQDELDTINEGNNIFWSLSNGDWWDSDYWLDEFSSGSNSVVIIDSNGNYTGSYDSNYFEDSNSLFVGGDDFDTYSYTGPIFVDPDGYRHEQDLINSYTLASGSDAIGAADADEAPATDLLGNPRDASPDAGCYEYNAGTPDTTAPFCLKVLHKLPVQYLPGLLQNDFVHKKFGLWVVFVFL